MRHIVLVVILTRRWRWGNSTLNSFAANVFILSMILSLISGVSATNIPLYRI